MDGARNRHRRCRVNLDRGHLLRGSRQPHPEGLRRRVLEDGGCPRSRAIPGWHSLYRPRRLRCGPHRPLAHSGVDRRDGPGLLAHPRGSCRHSRLELRGAPMVPRHDLRQAGKNLPYQEPYCRKPQCVNARRSFMKKNRLSDYFACTYIINLPERRDRRKAILGELERVGMPLSPGKVELFPAVKPKERLGFPNIGVRGCFLSHYQILTDALRRNLANVLIVEDDLMISPQLQSYWKLILAELESQDWGIVYLGHIEKVPESSPPRLVPFNQPVITSHFYAVNGAVIPRLIEYLALVQTREEGDPLGGPMHLDGALTMFRQANPDVLTLIAYPNLGKQRPSRSNINCPWYERLPVVQQAADLGRLVRDRLRA